MQDSRDIYAAIHHLLASEGLVILHIGRIPVNPVNLFDVLVARSSGVVVEVDEGFVEEARDRSGEPSTSV